MALIVLVVIVLLLAVVYITLYNGLQKAKVYTEESWSQIDVQLKRRNDLILIWSRQQRDMLSMKKKL